MKLEVVNDFSSEILNYTAEQGFNLIYNLPEIQEYITRLAYKYWYKTSGLWDVDDYKQYLRIGLFDAVQRFKKNPSKPLAYYIYNRFKFNISKANQLCYSKKEINNSSACSLDTIDSIYTEDISEGIIFQVSLTSSLEKYIKKSPFNQKRVEIFLYRLEGYPVKEIAEIFHCSDAYVYECLHMVRKYLESEGVLQ